MDDQPNRDPHAIRLEELPLLALPVGLYGSPRHVELGGAACFGVVITVGTYIAG